MGKRLDLTGQRFGRLTVIIFDKIQNKSSYWLCYCDCGKITSVCGSNLKRGNCQSCGCYSVEMTIKRSTKYKNRNQVHSSEYIAWDSMKQRCLNPKHKSYKDYGARNIKICDRWINSFESFLKDMGPKPSKNHSIDRVDVDGDYEPSNCRWVTLKEQCNNKRNNVIIEDPFDGESLNISQLCEKHSLKRSKLYYHYRTKNLPLDQAIQAIQSGDF